MRPVCFCLFVCLFFSFSFRNCGGGGGHHWRMTQNMLTGLIRLRSLDLSSNKLTLIDGALETLITLEQLNLRGNALAVLGPDIFKVKRISISYNTYILSRVS
jgi:hypothetical protein